MPTTMSSLPRTGPTVRATPTGSGGTAYDPDRGMPEPDAESPEEQSSHSADDTLKNLVQQVNNGDNAALGRLRGVLDKNPEIWRSYTF
jgi:hypothetical protein